MGGEATQSSEQMITVFKLSGGHRPMSFAIRIITHGKNDVGKHREKADNYLVSKPKSQQSENYRGDDDDGN